MRSVLDEPREAFGGAEPSAPCGRLASGSNILFARPEELWAQLGYLPQERVTADRRASRP